jgi:hypothetical protein
VSASETTNKTEDGWAPRWCLNAFSVLFFCAFKRSSFLMRWKCKHEHKMKAGSEDSEAQNVKQLGGEGGGGLSGMLARIHRTKYKWKAVANVWRKFLYLRNKMWRTRLVFCSAGWPIGLLVISRHCSNYCSSQIIITEQYHEHKSDVFQFYAAVPTTVVPTQSVPLIPPHVKQSKLIHI